MYVHTPEGQRSEVRRVGMAVVRGSLGLDAAHLARAGGKNLAPRALTRSRVACPPWNGVCDTGTAGLAVSEGADWQFGLSHQVTTWHNVRPYPSSPCGER